ncbi:hypothetical protein GCM10007424_16350 [Flavobacterium suaedae]|uniref:Uncharacterized protein n=1 Tax=Flavobacterium suaedae TaxID=1767027 RepID=A0ABQ1JT33_9FLAO|nr:hypothetical protein [Flavobacterium suaedae]GGB77064.1 hypothetical protein GCM10007424_16350 [Flavobacterium suaedae]
MKQLVVILYTICVIPCTLAQTALSTNEKTKLTAYADFYMQGSRLYGLTVTDTLTVWDTISPKPIQYHKNVQTIAQNRKNELCYIKNNELYNYVTGVKQPLSRSKGKVYNLFFDEANNPIVYTSTGILIYGDYYLPNKDDGYSIWSYNEDGKDDIVNKPKACYLDEKSRLWLGFDNGESGGALVFFDLKLRKFIAPNSLFSMYIEKYRGTEKVRTNYLLSYDFNELVTEFPEEVKIIEKDTLYKFPTNITAGHPKGITGNRNGTLYISQSSINFFIMGTGIIKVSPTAYKDFYKITFLNDILEHEEISNEMVVAEYVGSVTYNTFDRHAYYYSDLGFFKITENTDGSFAKEFIAKPEISWSGQPNAVGSGMNVKKFRFTAPDKFFFLTTNNGIGYYNGKTFKYFK